MYLGCCMASHAILAEKAVSVSEARKNLSQYFIDEPVAVLSNNKPTGYMLSAELYEKMLRIIEASGVAEPGLFRPGAARLKEISRLSEQLLLEADAANLGEFSEWFGFLPGPSGSDTEASHIFNKVTHKFSTVKTLLVALAALIGS